MEQKFTLSFEHKKKQYDLEAKFVRLGYIHQFHVSIEGCTLIIEFDEERNYRVIENSGKPFDQEFLQALVNKISSFL